MKKTPTTRFGFILAFVFIIIPCFSIDYGLAAGATEETEETGYVILTDFPETSPEYPSILKLREFRDATIIHFSGDVFTVLTPMRDARPTHVAIVTSPDRIDESFAYDVFMLAKQMDDNFDTDFAYGFITGNSAAEIDDYIDRVIAFETGLAEMPREFRSLWRTGDGAFGGGIGNWGDRLSDQMVWYYDYAGCNAFRIDTDSADKSLYMEEVAQTGIIHILVHGAVTMTEAFNYSEIPQYQHPVMVFNNGCYGGCTSKWYSQCIPTPPSGLYEDRAQTVNPEQSFALNYLKNGAIAYYGHMCMWGKNIWPQNLTESLLTDLSRSTGEILTDWYNIPGSTNIVTAEDTVGPQANDLFGIDLNRFDYSAIVLYGDPAVTIKNLNMPPLIDYLPAGIEFCSGSQYQLNMDQYVEDLNDPVSTLEWEITGTDSIGLNYDPENRILEITALNNEISTDTIFMKVSDPGGAFCRDTLIVLVKTAPDHPGAIQGVTETCDDEELIYSISGIPEVTYGWNVTGGTLIESGPQATVTWLSAGTHLLKVTPYNSCGPGPFSQIEVEVNSVPGQPGPIQGETGVCAGEELEYNISEVQGISYAWSASGGTVTGTGHSVDVIWSSPGIFDLTVTPSNECGEGPVSMVTVTVDTIPPQPGEISGEIHPVAGELYIYEIPPVENADDYTWTVSSGSAEGQQNTANVIWESPGTHTISVKAYNSCGESTERVLAVEVMNPAGIENSEADNACMIFPNPAKDWLLIFCNRWEGKFLTFEVSDLSGRKLLSERKTVFRETTLDLAGFSAGTFILMIHSNERMIFRRMVIIE